MPDLPDESASLETADAVSTWDYAPAPERTPVEIADQSAPDLLSRFPALPRVVKRDRVEALSDSQALIEAANLAGGEDNITVAIIDVLE